MNNINSAYPAYSDEAKIRVILDRDQLVIRFAYRLLGTFKGKGGLSEFFSAVEIIFSSGRVFVKDGGSTLESNKELEHSPKLKLLGVKLKLKSSTSVDTINKDQEKLFVSLLIYLQGIQNILTNHRKAKLTREVAALQTYPIVYTKSDLGMIVKSGDYISNLEDFFSSKKYLLTSRYKCLLYNPNLGILLAGSRVTIAEDDEYKRLYYLAIKLDAIIKPGFEPAYALYQDCNQSCAEFYLGVAQTFCDFLKIVKEDNTFDDLIIPMLDNIKGAIEFGYAKLSRLDTYTIGVMDKINNIDKASWIGCQNSTESAIQMAEYLIDKGQILRTLKQEAVPPKESASALSYARMLQLIAKYQMNEELPLTPEFNRLKGAIGSELTFPEDRFVPIEKIYQALGTSGHHINLFNGVPEEKVESPSDELFTQLGDSFYNRPKQ